MTTLRMTALDGFSAACKADLSEKQEKSALDPQTRFHDLVKPMTVASA